MLIFFIKLRIDILMFILVFIFLGFVEEGAVLGVLFILMILVLVKSCMMRSDVIMGEIFNFIKVFKIK